MLFNEIPNLKPVTRNREYKLYSDDLRDEVVYQYLFHARTHRELDKEVLGLDSLQSRGFQSMGILHHIGLKGEYQGIFEGVELEHVLSELEKKGSSFVSLVQILKRFQQRTILKDGLIEVIKNDLVSEEAEEEDSYLEGEVKTYYGKRYERNVKNRINAIKAHGTSCMVCDFNFGEFYGSHGRDFIEVHHLEPISTFEKERIINPVTDLAPVCSNCHRMLHRNKNKVLSIEDLKNLIKKSES